MAAAAVVTMAAVPAGCRSEGKATAAQATAATGPAVPWSCGAVHDERPLVRALGHGGRLTLGAVADTNGTAPATMANLRRIGGVFSDAHVDAVVALGDLGRTEDEIAAVLTALATSARAPVLALAGEREPEGAFHAAVRRARAAGADVIDLVDTRLVDTGSVDVVALPGYPFASKGCHYVAADLDGAARIVSGRQHARVVVAHTPPREHGADAIDWAIGDVNAGDAAMAAIVERLAPRAALFAHVDEAGGRATGEEVNVGSVERGMAAIVELADGRATHRVVRP